MLRRLPWLLSASAVIFTGLIGIAIWQYVSDSKVERVSAESLSDPLGDEAAADFAGAQHVIDELRQLRGSVLDGTSLATLPANDASADDYIALLRREARRLESAAADHEDDRDFGRADDLRGEASRLWDQARKLDDDAQLTRGGKYLEYERR